MNEFTELELRADRPPPPAYPVAYDAAKALHAVAKAHGVYGYGAQWAGQGVALSRTMPAGDLTHTLAAELDAAMGTLEGVGHLHEVGK